MEPNDLTPAPAPTPTPIEFENDADMLGWVGTDASRWAALFRQNVLGGGDALNGHGNAIDDGSLVAWFANAIETAKDAGGRQMRKSLAETPLPVETGDGEPPNTMTRMAAAIEWIAREPRPTTPARAASDVRDRTATAAHPAVNPDSIARLRAAWLEVIELRHADAAVLEQMRAERGAWIDRAAGLYYVIDRIDDHAEQLDPSEASAAITRQIDRSRVIVHTNGAGAEVWGEPPTRRGPLGEAMWWPPETHTGPQMTWPAEDPPAEPPR